VGENGKLEKYEKLVLLVLKMSVKNWWAYIPNNIV
jgi:hypothetical protein